MSTTEEKTLSDHGVTRITDIESKLSENGPDSPTSPRIDPQAEARLVRKLDLVVYPVLFIVYMMSFLDRINISNARIQGLVKDLDLTGNRFNIALFVCLQPQGATEKVN
jgi:hypothetical protein